MGVFDGRVCKPSQLLDAALLQRMLVFHRTPEEIKEAWFFSRKDLFHHGMRGIEMQTDRLRVSSRPMTHDTQDRNNIYRYLSQGAVFSGDGAGGGQQFCGPYYDNRVSHHHLPLWAQKKRFWVTCSGIALISILGIMATSIALVIERKGGDSPSGSAQSSG